MSRQRLPRHRQHTIAALQAFAGLSPNAAQLLSQLPGRRTPRVSATFSAPSQPLEQHLEAANRLEQVHSYVAGMHLSAHLPSMDGESLSHLRHDREANEASLALRTIQSEKLPPLGQQEEQRRTASPSAPLHHHRRTAPGSVPAVHHSLSHTLIHVGSRGSLMGSYSSRHQSGGSSRGGEADDGLPLPPDDEGVSGWSMDAGRANSGRRGSSLYSKKSSAVPAASGNLTVSSTGISDSRPSPKFMTTPRRPRTSFDTATASRFGDGSGSGRAKVSGWLVGSAGSLSGGADLHSNRALAAALRFQSCRVVPPSWPSSTPGIVTPSECMVIGIDDTDAAPEVAPEDDSISRVTAGGICIDLALSEAELYDQRPQHLTQPSSSRKTGLRLFGRDSWHTKVQPGGSTAAKDQPTVGDMSRQRSFDEVDGCDAARAGEGAGKTSGSWWAACLFGRC